MERGGHSLGRLVVFVLLVIVAVPNPGPDSSFTEHPIIGLSGVMVCVLFWVMYLAVATKRLHDLDRSGLWILLVFVPIVNVLQLIYLGVMDGTKGKNRFGLEPP